MNKPTTFQNPSVMDEILAETQSGLEKELNNLEESKKVNLAAKVRSVQYGRMPALTLDEAIKEMKVYNDLGLNAFMLYEGVKLRSARTLERNKEVYIKLKEPERNEASYKRSKAIHRELKERKLKEKCDKAIYGKSEEAYRNDIAAFKKEHQKNQDRAAAKFFKRTQQPENNQERGN